jgi:hypothetical protein
MRLTFVSHKKVAPENLSTLKLIKLCKHMQMHTLLFFILCNQVVWVFQHKQCGGKKKSFFFFLVKKTFKKGAYLFISKTKNIG